jgi:hypothetical protein
MKAISTLLVLIFTLSFNADTQTPRESVGAAGGFSSPTAEASDEFYANRKELNCFPFRRLAAKYCDLRPLFLWGSTKPDGRGPHPNPMPAWRPLIRRIEDTGVLTNGLVLRNWIRDDQPPVFLINYPIKTNLIDGAPIECLAVESGTTNLRGHNLKLFDFGIPFDPKQIAATNR